MSRKSKPAETPKAPITRSDIEAKFGELRGEVDAGAQAAKVPAIAVAVGAAVLTVVDDGPGIPADERERVFERFARLDDARDRDAGGTGLGLAIVRELLQRSDGSVSLQDNPSGPGLTAVVHLPT